MTATRLGRRYERLLFLAGPISLMSLFILFIALASDDQKERFQSRCLLEAAAVLEQSKTTLDIEWDRQRLLIDAQEGSDYKYDLALTTAWLFNLHAGSRCYDYVQSLPNQYLFSSPDVLIDKFRRTAAIPIGKPIYYYGIEIPEVATVGIFGTNIKMELMTLTQFLQMGLAPILLLWLGSLYNTRFREIKLISVATQITEVFPHLINFYPVGVFKQLRKRSKLQYYLPAVVAIIYFLIRACLIAMFVGPSVVFYALSLFYLYSPQSAVLFSILGALIVILGVGNVLGEISILHLWKRFPGPYTIGYGVFDNDAH